MSLLLKLTGAATQPVVVHDYRVRGSVVVTNWTQVTEATVIGAPIQYVRRGSVGVNGWDYVVPTAVGPVDTAVNPDSGSLTITGYAPTVTRTTGSSYGVAHSYVNRGSQAVISWMADGLGVDAGAITPGAGTLTITGYAPTIAQSANQSVSPGVGSLTFTGYAPTVTQAANQAVSPGAGSLAITGYAPSIAQSSNVAVNPAAGALSITGYAPTVAQSSSVSLAPDVGTLAITGYAPSVVQTVSDPVIGVVHTYVGRGSVQVVSWLSDGVSVELTPTTTTGGGSYGKNKKRYIVKKNGKLLVFGKESDALNELTDDDLETVETVADVPADEVQIASIDLPAVKQYAQVIGLIDDYRAAYKSKHYEALIALFEQMQEEQDIEELLLLV